jgi:hypothetical protein
MNDEAYFHQFAVHQFIYLLKKHGDERGCGYMQWTQTDPIGYEDVPYATKVAGVWEIRRLCNDRGLLEDDVVAGPFDNREACCAALLMLPKTLEVR